MATLGDGAGVTHCLFFDMDGTLVKAEGAGNSVHRHAFTVALKAVWGIDCVISEVDHGGRTDQWIIRALLGVHGVHDEEVITAGLPRAYALMVDEVREHRREMGQALSVLPGIPALLSTLSRRRDVALGLVTGNLTRIAMTKLVCTGLDTHFVAGGFGEDGAVRAHLVSAGLERVRARLPALRPTHQLRVFVIGDTPHDLQAAAESGSLGVGVCTGRHSREVLEGLTWPAHAIVDDFSDTAAALAVFGLTEPALEGDPAALATATE